MRGEIDLVILAGGAATRLGPLGHGGPKALLPVQGRPFIAWPLAMLAANAPLGRVVICARAQHAPQFRSVVGTLGYRFVVLEENAPMGTGGAILSAMARTPLSNPFMVMNGDVLFSVDVPALVESALRHGAALSAINVADRTRFGALDVIADGPAGPRIRGFFEKQRPSSLPPGTTASMPAPGLISAGLYAFMHESLRDFPLGPCSFEYDIAPVLAARGWLGAAMTHGGFLDIGTPASYAGADAFVAATRIPNGRPAIQAPGGMPPIQA